MKNIKSSIKKIRKFLKKNIFLSLFIAIVAFVGFIVVFRMLTAQPEYIYTKIKVSQGLWWANTVKPSIWLAENIQKGDVEKNLTGKPIVQILEVRKYPWWGTDEYNVFITAKLEVSKNKNTGKYSFKRSTVGIGSPIDLEFPELQISGTIIALSERPIQTDVLKTKTVTMVKKMAFPWEYDAISIGDTYFDGEDVSFEIIDKKTSDYYATFSSVDNNYPIDSEPRVNITVTAKILLERKENNWVYGEDQIIKLGKILNISTDSYSFQNFIVSSIK